MGRRIAAPYRLFSRISVFERIKAATMPITNWPSIAEKKTNSAESPRDWRKPDDEKRKR
jgi:hypothetical protein